MDPPDRERRGPVTDRAPRDGRERAEALRVPREAPRAGRDRREAPRDGRARSEATSGGPERRRARPPERDGPAVTDRPAGECGPEEAERPRRARSRPGGPLTARTAARLAATRVVEMTGKEAEGVTALEKSDEGLWQIDVEVVETRRIPDSTDILAIYRVELDPEGELVAYRRIERHSRGQVGER